MRINVRHILLTILSALAAIMPIDPAYAKKKAPVKSDNSDELKADYIFMEALRQNSSENEDAYFELLRRAHELNPKESDIEFYLGFYTMLVARNDSAMGESGYNMMRNHFDKEPSDFYNNRIYGAISDQLGKNQEAIRVWRTLDSIYPNKIEVALKLASALTTSRDSAQLKEAEAIYNKIETTQGKSIPLSFNKIRTYLPANDTVAIFNEVRDLIATSPRNVDNNIFAGDVYAQFNMPDTALVFYNRACEIDPSSGAAYYSRATLYQSIGDSLAYDREVFNALKQESLDLDTKLELLTGYIRELYEDESQHPRIEELFSSLLQQHPHESKVRELYCSYLYVVDDFAGAAEQMGYALDIDPANVENWHTLITLYMQAEKPNEAEKAGENALHYYPDSPQLDLLMSAVYNQNKKFDMAQNVLDKAMQSAGADDRELLSQIYSSKGDSFYAAGSTDSAFVYYEKALEFNPYNLLAMNNCAYHLAVEGRDLDRAERLSATTIKERPDDATSLDTYAWVLFKKKDYTQAQAYIQKALDNSPEPSEELYEHAGDIFFFTGDHAKAVEFWEKALDLAPDNELLKRKVKHRTYFYE
ncbi:MAG: tetratricopeptide repeat protein [Muribaculum sp.]|nr:tetratricopeptide repeat protein [Muribaculum sp.]